MTDFLEAVARRSEVDVVAVNQRFQDHDVVLAPTAPTPHSLRVTHVCFGGTKRLPDHNPEEFRYDRPLDTGLWVVASTENLAGKSTVLHVIRWALTGRSRLRDDVRSWIGNVRVEGTVDDHEFVIAFDDVDGGPNGTLSFDGDVVGSFGSPTSFEAMTGAFFSEKLGLDPTPFWQSRPGGEEGEGDPRRLGWQGYFPALHVRSGAGPLLGDQMQGGQPGTLMQVFLGLPWALTAATARVALATVRRDLNAARRRGRDDAAAREGARAPLEERLAAARASYDELTRRAAPPSAEDADARVSRFQRLSAELSALSAEVETAKAAVALAEQEADASERRLLAIRETAAVRPLLGRIQPSQCPRCSHELLGDRAGREADEHCFVCDAPLQDAVEDELEAAEVQADAEAAEQAVAAARAECGQLERRQQELEQERAEARQAVDELTDSAPAMAERQAAERDIAVLEALLEQDRQVQQQAQDTSDLEHRERVLAAALTEATSRRDEAARAFRARLGDEIVVLGRRFGIENLEAADPKLNAALRVTTGGVESNFGDLTAGEQLRLRIATLIGLLRIGTAQGIGRFPGMLLIDSPGSEEMVDVDAAEILGELAVICEEQHNLQVIVASARPDLIQEMVPANHLLGADDLGKVF